jgi:hypothetical protein
VRAKRSLRRLIVVLGVIALPLASSAGFDDFMRDGNTKFRIVVAGGGLAPTTTTLAATAVMATTATLEGQAIPNGVATTGWFRYDDADPGSCDDSFGTRVPGSSGTDIGDGGIAAPFDEEITGLTGATIYYYCAIAENAQGKTFGEVLTFQYQLPVVVTVAADDITATSVTLNATGNPAGLATEGWFRYSTVDPGTCDDSFGTRIPAVSGGTALGSGSAPVAYDEAPTYYFCGIAENSEGKAYGSVLSFTTLTPDIEFLSAASSSGLPAVGSATACSNAAFTSIATGAQAWCFEGDEGQTGLTFTENNTTTVETEQECPNGIDCTSVPRIRVPTGAQNGWKTADQGAITSDFTCWAMWRAGNTASNTFLIQKYESGGLGVKFGLVHSNATSLLAQFRSSTPTNYSASLTSNVQFGAIQFVVVTVDQNGGTGGMKLYSDSMATEAAGSSSIGAETMETTASPWTIGYQNGTNSQASDIFLAGCTEQLLTANQRQALKDVALGTLKDRTSTLAVTTTRAITSVDCPASNGSRTSGIGPNRACVAGDGSGNPRMFSHFAGFNQAIQSESIDNASWTKTGSTFAAPVVTANVVAAPDGNMTADRVVFPAISPGATKVSYVRMASPTAIAGGNPFSAGVWLRISAGTGKVYLWQKYSTASQTLTSTACNLTTTWSFCSNLNDTSHAGTNAHHMFIGFDNDALGQGADTLAGQTVYVSKVQWHAISSLAQYCPTTTATVQCAGNQHSFVKPSASLSNTTGCMGVTVTPTRAVAEGYLMRFGSDGYMSFDSDELKCSDGTNTAILAITDPSNTTIRAVCTWTGTTLTVKQIGGSSDSDTYDGAMFSAGDVTTYLGHNNNANYANGWLSRITFDDTVTGCD